MTPIDETNKSFHPIHDHTPQQPEEEEALSQPPPSQSVRLRLIVAT